MLSTCGSKPEAEAIAGRLIEDGAAACVNIVDKITSVYQWKGKTEKTSETLLIIKTRAALIDRVKGTIAGLSAYDCPEVIVLPVAEGSQEYLNWIDEVTGKT